MSSLKKVKCIKCNTIIGYDYKIINIESCISCKKKKKKTINTEQSSFARTKKGKALDLADKGNYYFRSGWERDFARYLTKKGIDWSYERNSFSFSVDPKTGKSYTRKPWVYIPDFHDKNNDIYYEVKGYLRSQDRSKIRRLKVNYPEEFIKLVAVVSKSNKAAIKFYKMYKVPLLYIEDLKKEYKSLCKDGENYWESK